MTYEFKIMCAKFVALLLAIVAPRAFALQENPISDGMEYIYTAEDIVEDKGMFHYYGALGHPASPQPEFIYPYYVPNYWPGDHTLAEIIPLCLVAGPKKNFLGSGKIEAEIEFAYIDPEHEDPQNPNFIVSLTASNATEILDIKRFWAPEAHHANTPNDVTVSTELDNYPVLLKADHVKDKRDIEVRVCGLHNKIGVAVTSVTLRFIYNQQD